MNRDEKIIEFLKKVKFDPKKYTKQMLRDRQTDVDLTDIAQKIREKYHDFGLKNILSASLVLFDNETEVEQIMALFVARGIISPNELEGGARKSKRIDDAVAFIRKVKAGNFIDSKQPSIPTTEYLIDEAILELTKALGSNIES